MLYVIFIYRIIIKIKINAIIAIYKQGHNTPHTHINQQTNPKQNISIMKIS